MESIVRFALPFGVDAAAAAAAFDELKMLVLREAGPLLSPVLVPSYAALYSAIADGHAAAAWSPPLVARDFLRAEVADPLVAAKRFDEVSYYSALVVPHRSSLVQVDELAGRRMGWVSKLSAAGYVVPRWFLRSAGYDVDTLFSAEHFAGSHASLGAALASSTIDVAATYATVRGEAFFTADLGLAVRTLAIAGPIPADVVVARRDFDLRARTALARALTRIRFEPGGAVRAFLDADRFVPASEGHLSPLTSWEARADSVAPRPSTPVGRHEP